jgi:hypothetical protein
MEARGTLGVRMLNSTSIFTPTFPQRKRLRCDDAVRAWVNGRGRGSELNSIPCLGVFILPLRLRFVMSGDTA